MNRAILAVAVVGGLAVAGGALWLSGGQVSAPGQAPAGIAAAPAPQAPAAPTQAPSDKPSFDVVRVEPDGRAVIAGRAAPGSSVTLFDGAKELGSVTADSRGEWVYLPDQPLAPGGRELRLEATGPDGQRQDGQGTVVLVVPERNQDVAGRKQGETGGALALLTGPEGGASRVLQAPQAGGPPGAVSLDAVDYDRAGNVTVGGQAAPGAEVMLYLDNALVGRAKADPAGRWSISPGRNLDPGSYTLRADQLGPEGKVAGRAEVAFDKRPLPENALGDKAVVVLPGNNLWAIARRSYGEGLRYSLIFQANEGQIRDPALIYPGQIFLLPPEKPKS
ncbi:LysM peptidoglycan-binding domain-containing protein [Aerophototrophica crusticola]|uniref:LysM peptidoglycan-binding domain-containing protein n=1 Tax=Aerophototrophica crusticola TaxID=1709002 RepID=UPI0009518170